MKKFISVLAVVSLLVTIIIPFTAVAQPPETLPEGCQMQNDVGVAECPEEGFCSSAGTAAIPGVPAVGTPGEAGYVPAVPAVPAIDVCGPQGRWGVCCMLNTLFTVTNWVFYIMTIIAVLMIVFGGFTYITAAGDPTKAGKGKSILTFAIIGLAIALIAKLIPSLVRFILGV